MKPTSRSVEKAVENAYKKLTPTERGRLVSNKWWDLVEARNRGDDVTTIQKELDQLIWENFSPLSCEGKVDYLFERYDYDTTRIAAACYQGIVAQLRQQDFLLDMVLDFLAYLRYHEIEMCEPEKKETPEWVALEEMLITLFNSFKKYPAAMASQREEIINASFWKENNIPPPTTPETPESWLSVLGFPEPSEDTE
jgi:hypothetical protein